MTILDGAAAADGPGPAPQDPALDGNAIGGLLIEVFGTEMTTASSVCASCGTISQVGELSVYLPELVADPQLFDGLGARSLLGPIPDRGSSPPGSSRRAGGYSPVL